METTGCSHSVRRRVPTGSGSRSRAPMRRLEMVLACSDSLGDMVRVEHRGPADGLDVGYEGKRGVRNDPRFVA